ncbi:Rieske (2Fe-2S) protein [Adhaeribacter arboris]|uniref:Rieske (2Fe-2S) protein n=1 Tax=Adhaeribacter arboris TaxID=2072846 RepID=A0A2T2YMN6_9BACT|nr:Rieske 2Fe-2S domain-containing protein [Adhaeribacter arboris]PSR56772.1 Rieske (2Fe-2S) protein [Adhaeribacter arboris]
MPEFSPTRQHKLFDSIAAAEQSLPLGKPQKLWVTGRAEAICLVRTRKGIFAVSDVCPHLGESLSKGTTNYLNEVVCPWHSYRFSLLNGQECTNRTSNLKTFPVKVQPDGIYLQL